MFGVMMFVGMILSAIRLLRKHERPVPVLPARNVFEWSQWRHVHELYGLCGRRLHAALYRRAKNQVLGQYQSDSFPVGHLSGCSTVGIDEHVLAPLRVFPNPTSGVVRIDASAMPGRRILIDLLDVTGRQLLQQIEVNGIEQSVDLSSFSNGLYLLRLTGEEGSTLMHRIALER